MVFFCRSLFCAFVFVVWFFRSHFQCSSCKEVASFKEAPFLAYQMRLSFRLNLYECVCETRHRFPQLTIYFGNVTIAEFNLVFITICYIAAGKRFERFFFSLLPLNLNVFRIHVKASKYGHHLQWQQTNAPI